MGTPWVVGDTGVDITIPLLNEDGSVYAWPVGYQSITAYLTRLSDNVRFSVGAVAGSAVVGTVTTVAAVLPGVILDANANAACGVGLYAGEYAVEIVVIDATGEAEIAPTAGGLRLPIRKRETGP